ncbi:hypothetical protein BDV28DRAFT_45161 [Aspergillus coremiiformis]|uniref:Uncharacterized protein n=1 Tax=Aspergillus coremiiformis TaxID=138285 RepID=A0A5N6ZGW9_9EURO|nr:hypothetical protein BDV28DRAFT_45161 [Aspergillus coremiiformis]
MEFSLRIRSTSQCWLNGERRSAIPNLHLTLLLIITVVTSSLHFSLSFGCSNLPVPWHFPSSCRQTPSPVSPLIRSMLHSLVD